MEVMRPGAPVPRRAGRWQARINAEPSKETNTMTTDSELMAMDYAEAAAKARDQKVDRRARKLALQQINSNRATRSLRPLTRVQAK